MAERLDFHLDIDHDQPPLDWGDVLAEDPQALGWVMRRVRRSRGRGGVMRALAIHDWLADIRYPGLLLKTAFDDDGFAVEGPNRLPTLLVEVEQEDLSTRPEKITQWRETVALGGVDREHIDGAQWLDLDGAVDVDALREAYAPDLARWRERIDDAFRQWMAQPVDRLMAVATVETTGPSPGPRATWEVSDDIRDWPMHDRQQLVRGAAGGPHRRLLECLKQQFPDAIAHDQHTALVSIHVPSAKRRAELERRRLDQATQESPAARAKRARL